MAFSILIYVSDLAPGLPSSTVAKIAKEARARNEQDGITGLLTFDGAHFAQLVEGPTGRLEDLLARLQVDARHAAMEVLHFEPTQGDRLFTGWGFGFIEVAARGGMQSLRGFRGTEALQAFLNALPPLSADTDISMPKMAEDGPVLEGSDGVVVTMNADAADKTAESLRQAAAEARTQPPPSPESGE